MAMGRKEEEFVKAEEMEEQEFVEEEVVQEVEGV